MSITMNSNSLVIGAGGFIGCNLSIALKEKQHNIYACDTFFSSQVYSDLQKKDINIIEGGVEGLLLDLENYKHINNILYFAGNSTPALVETELSRGYFSDQEALVMMLEACKKLPNLNNFVYASSGGTVYGIASIAHKETSAIKPISSYGLSKIIQEEYIQFYARKLGFKAKIARISNPYGRKPSQHNNKNLQGFIDVAIEKTIHKQNIQIWGDGTNIRDFIHIKDLASGLSTLLDPKLPAGIYNLGSGTGHSLNQIINIIKNCKLDIKIDYIDSRVIDVPQNTLDISKLTSLSHWHPKITQEAGINMLLSHYRDLSMI